MNKNTRSNNTPSPRRVAPIILGILLGISCPLQAGIVLEESFTAFTLGNPWRPHGAGAPDVALSIVGGIGADGSSLRMAAAPGAAGETVGIEMATPIPLAGVQSVRVTARMRPLNQTAAGDGGASDASAGVAIFSASGAFVRASAGANRPTAPDWGDFYRDSEGSADATAAFLHFPPNDPAGSAEAFRTYVLEIGPEGTKLTTLSSTGEPLVRTPFDIVNPNLTLKAFGNSVTVALFQERSDNNLAPENTFGDFDSIQVETVSASDDTDNDGMPNAYETAHSLNPNSNDAQQDLDNDGLKNLAEFQRGTAANNPDTDGDGLKDGVETGTGVYVSPADTGTNPLKTDSDNDGLGDAVETNSGTYVSSTNTGTDPSKSDTDGDGFSDGVEAGAGFNPTKMESTPAGASSIRTAVEFQFFAAPGVNYRIEGSADMQTWTTVEATIPGAGNRVTRLYSTEGKPLRFFRAAAN